jgi:hypothetical protein
MRARRWGGNVDCRRGDRRAVLQDPEAAAQPARRGRPARRGGEREAGADDRKEGIIETEGEYGLFICGPSGEGAPCPIGPG